MASMVDWLNEIAMKNGRHPYPTEHTRRFDCRQGVIVLRFTTDYRDLRKALGSDQPSKRLWECTPEILARVTRDVHIEVKPNDESGHVFSAHFTGAECAAALGDHWPCSETFLAIAGAVREKKHYPLPTPEIPGGGKSMTAQGQTKKPGSHSQDKHH